MLSKKPMNAIHSFVSIYTTLSKESLVAFQKIFTKKEFSKKDIIANEGDKHDYFYILESGIVRSYLIDKKGNERIRTLFLPISAIASIPSLAFNEASKAEYQCLTNCTVYQGNFYEFKKLANSNLEISNLYNIVLEKAYSRIEDRVNSLFLLDATERYLLLKKRAPEIENLIPLYHIAAYLNITPIQLSRIRKNLYSK